MYALGRPIEAEDMPAVREIVSSATDNNFEFYDIVQEHRQHRSVSL